MTVTSEHPTLTMPSIRKVIGVAEMVAAGAVSTLSVAIGDLPAGAIISSAYAIVKITPASGTVTALGLELGIAAGDVDRYAVTGDVFGAAAGIDALGGPGAASAGGVVIPSTEAAAVLITATTDTLDAMTAGEFEVVIHYSEGRV